MSKPLYDALEIPADADHEAVKRAYKKKARETHPDKNGGNGDKFAIVKHAYDVLSDDARRKRYDETGDDSEGGADNELAATLEVVDMFMQKTFTEIDSRRLNPLQCDVVAMMLRHIDAEIARGEKNKAAGEEVLKKSEKMLGRFSSKDDTNYLDRMVKWKIDTFRKSQESITERIDVLKRAREIVENHTFEHEPAPEPKGMPLHAYAQQQNVYYGLGNHLW